MTHTIEATFDGTALHPDAPVELVQGTRYRLIVEPLPIPNAEPNAENVWSLLAGAAGSIDAPPDWASEHDHYLYGSAKQDPQP